MRLFSSKHSFPVREFAWTAALVIIGALAVIVLRGSIGHPASGGAPNIDSDDGIGHFHSHMCGKAVCATVQLNAVEDEYDLPIAAGRYLTGLMRAARNGSVQQPGASIVRLDFLAFHLVGQDKTVPVRWARLDVDATALTFAPRPESLADPLRFVRKFNLPTRQPNSM